MQNTSPIDARLALANPACEEWEKLQALLKTVRYNGQSASHVFALVLATNSYEIACAMLKLWEVGAEGGQLPLLRALLESSSRFAYLARAPKENSLKLELVDIQEALKALGRTQADGDSPKKMERRIRLLSREDELAKQSVKHAPSIYDVVREVGSPELYDVYRILSGHAHAQWSALSQRTVQKNEHGSYVTANSLLDDMTVEFLWEAVTTLLAAIRYDFDKFQFESNARPDVSPS